MTDVPSAQRGTSLAPAMNAPLVAVADVQHLLDAWLLRQQPTTRLAYGRDIECIATWAGFDMAEAFVEHLLRATPLDAALLVQKYLDEVRRVDGDEALAPSTKNRRLAAVRSLARLARSVGLIAWTLEVPGLKVRAYRDTRGPDLADVRRLLAAAASQCGTKALRDVSLVGLLYALALRRTEICSLDIEHYQPAGRCLLVKGKGHSDREPVTAPEQVAAWLGAYLAARGHPPAGALFVNVDRARKGSRLTPSGLYVIVKHLARKAGVDPKAISPHRLRHAAITFALDATRGDVRRVRQFSRHEKVETVLAYDDRRRDQAGEVATLVAAALGHPPRRHASQVVEPDAARTDDHGNARSRELLGDVDDAGASAAAHGGEAG